MKKTINVAIGGYSFTIDEDAYNTLNDYLERFKASLDNVSTGPEVMDELEVRIADLLKMRLNGRQVVNHDMVQTVIGELGYPEECKNADKQGWQNSCNKGMNGSSESERPVRKLFRDPDEKKIAGVCSGLSIFFGLDVVLIRIIFLMAMIFGMAGGLIYIIIWIAAPEARTAAEKCELRGLPVTAENIRKFTEGR